MSRSCHSVTFSSAGTTATRTIRARPHRFSLSTGLRLCGIAEEPFWPGWKNSSASRTSRPLQMPHLGRQPLDAAGDHAQGAEERRMAVARDDLGRHRFRPQPQPLGDIFFHPRIEMREGADRAADRGHRDLRPRRDQPLAAAGELGVMAGQLQPERRRFGVDAVAAADGQACICARSRARLQRCQHGVDIGQQQVGRLRQLHRQAGVQHVRAGHALMHEAAVRADRLGQPGQEGDDVVPGLPLDRVDPLDIGSVDRGQLRRRLCRGWCARLLPGWRRCGPCPRRRAPRSRTRSDSGSPAPRWRPSRDGSSAESCCLVR